MPGHRHARHRSARRARRPSPGITFALAAVCCAHAFASSATTFVVANLNDSGPGSLRQAVIDANAAAGADVVTFQPGLVGTIALGSQIDVTDTLTITGPGAAVLALRPMGSGRMLDIAGTAAVLVSGLAFQGNGASTVPGAAIRAATGALTVEDSTFTDNVTTEGGGGIYAAGALTVRRCAFSGNRAQFGGAIASSPGGSITVEASSFESNATSDHGAAAIDTFGTTVVRDSIFTANPATGGAGVVGLGALGYYTSANESLLVERSRFEGNATGAIYAIGNSIALRESTFVGNSRAARGGALDACCRGIEVSDSEFVGNRADRGGALYTFGKTTVLRSRFTANQALVQGGAIYGFKSFDTDSTLSIGASLFTANVVTGVVDGGDGGAVAAYTPTHIYDSTLTGNLAPGGGGVSVDQQGPTVISNSTIAGNSAVGAGVVIAGGGGILAYGAVRLESTNVTDNRAATKEGGIALTFPPSGIIELVSSIVAGNHDSSGNRDLPAALAITADHSLIGNTTGVVFAVDVANIKDRDPMLAPLADNGGPTPTQALLPGSPAVDAGANPSSQPFDQRGAGFPRVQGGAPDIGAFESPFGVGLATAVPALSWPNLLALIAAIMACALVWRPGDGHRRECPAGRRC